LASFYHTTPGFLVTEAFRAAPLCIQPEKDIHTSNYGDVNICVEGRPRFVTVVCNKQPSTNRESRQQHIGTLFHIIYRKVCLNKTTGVLISP